MRFEKWLDDLANRLQKMEKRRKSEALPTYGIKVQDITKRLQKLEQEQEESDAKHYPRSRDRS